jgi:hypothetical protein
MAIIENLFESGRGKLGNLVFYKVGGQGRVRTRATHFRDRKSLKQLAQRQRLQVVMGFLKPFSKLIRITFAAEAVGRSAMQAAQSYNMRNALAGEYPDIYMDNSRTLLSRGSLPLPESAKLTVTTEGLLIEWENGAEATGHHPYDNLLVMAKSSETSYTDFRFTEARRSDNHYMWKPALPEGNVDVWIAFRDQGQTVMSDSMFLR